MALKKNRHPKPQEKPSSEIEELRAQLAETQETLRAIGEGEVDAVIVSGSRGEQVFSLVGAESIYRLIVETMKEAAFTVTFEGKILFCNAQFSEFVKQPMERILGHGLSEFVDPANRSAAEALLIKAQDQPLKQPLVFADVDGRPVPAHVSANVLNQPDGLSICVVAADLTELEKSTLLIQELRLQKEVLRENELRYRTVADNTLNFEFWISPEGRFLYASPSCQRICGRNAADFLADPRLRRSIIHPNDLSLFDLHLAEEAKRNLGEAEFRIMRPDGSVVWMQHVCQPVYDERGNYLGIRGSNRDITEHKRAEAELRMSEERFRSVLENSSDAIYRLNLKTGKYEYFSPSTINVYGYSREEMMGMNEREAMANLHPEDRPAVDVALKRLAMSGKEEIEFRWKNRAGEYRWLSARSAIVRDATGQPLWRDGITRDITERKQAEESLRRSADRLQLLSSCANRLLATDNPQSIINELCREVMTHLDCQAFFNFLADEQAGRLHLNAFGGISEEEALNIEWLDYGVAVCGCAAQQNCRIVVEDILNVPDSRADLVRSYGIQAYCCHPLMAQDRVIGTLSFGTKTRAHFTPEDVDVMSTVADQVAVALQRVFNLRALRELNKSLDQRVNVRTAEVQRQARRLHVLAAELALTEQRERKRLAAVLHDHIQQILVAARMHLSLVKRAGSMTLGPAVQGVESLIREAIDATRSLAVDLSPPILHQGMLAPSLDWLANRMEEKHLFKVRVRADSAAEPEMESVRLMLFESVREVLLNAAKHSGVHEAEVMMVLDSDDWTRITIEDKGSGFDPKVANDNRSGLGLFAVQQRLSYIGGKMEVQSAPGRGTRVILLAPPEKARKNAPEPAAANSEVLEQELIGLSQKENKICILIVDDHRIVRQGLSSMLQLEPDLDIVAEAEDGEQALELARRFKPDVVITDVSMPGMDGVKLTRTLIQELPGVKVLGLSMHIEKDVAAAMRDAGAIGYLSKDGLSEDLITAIRACAVGR